jgi:hypothetical protein
MSTFNNGFIQSGDGNVSDPIHVGRPGQQVVFSNVTPAESYISLYPSIESVPDNFNGTVDIVTPTYRATVKGDGITKYTEGFGALANKPSATLFGAGTWQDGIKKYICDSVSWSDDIADRESIKLLSANESRLQKIRTRLEQAWAGTATNYIVTGDSTRNDRSYAVIDHIPAIMIEYYRYQLTKIHSTALTVFNNSISGSTATHWLDNTGTAKLNDALAQISGTGANSILEFSLGINDWTLSQNYFTNKTLINACLDALLAAKADLAILLVSPVRTSEFNGRPFYLEALYKEIAHERQLPLISGYKLMDDVYSATGPYNTDQIHPNEWGRKRVVDGVLNGILPESLFNEVTLEDRLISSNNLAGPIIVGKLWNTGTGVQQVSADWRSLPEITVYGATNLNITHLGNQLGVVCMDAGGTFIKNCTLDQTPTFPNYTATLPYNTHTVRINISNEGVTYDARNDHPSVYQSYMSLYNIDIGFGFKNLIA